MENKRLSWHDENALKAATKAINEGEIGVGDTDTIPGLFAACTAKGVAQLNAIKERSDKPYLMILGSQDGIFPLIKHPLKLQIEKLMENFWPGPLTIILPAQGEIPAYLQSKEGGIAIRVPKHEKMRELALLCGGLLSTSANFTGKPAPQTLDEVEPAIIEMAAFILYGPDYTKSDMPSTIIDAMGKQIRLVRQGAISLDELEAVAGTPFIR